MYPTKKATTFLNKALNLPATGHEQDWEIELADSDRVEEFVVYFENNNLDEETRLAMMALIMGSLEEASYGKETPPDIWERIKLLLRADPALYVDLLRHWAPQGDGCDDFSISKLVRLL